MMEYLKDKYLLDPFYKKLEFLHTKIGLSPNNITLINATIITNNVIRYWLNKNYIYAFLFLYLRNIFDGLDGYIARKYKLVSRVGDIYDHVSDSIFIGLTVMIFMYKLNFLTHQIYCTGNFAIILCLVSNFENKFIFIRNKIIGYGGSSDAYCTVTYLLTHFILYTIDNFIVKY